MYYVVFTILCVSGTTFLTWYDIVRPEQGDNYFDVIANTILVIGPAGLASAVIAMLLVNGRDAMGVVLENFKRQQFAEGLEQGREEGRELGRELGREEMMREMMGRIVALEAQLRARSNGEDSAAAAHTVAEVSESDSRDESREEMLKRIAALERAVVELLASRHANDDNEK